MDDICTADSCDENTILLYLKRRFEKKSIYVSAKRCLYKLLINKNSSRILKFYVFFASIFEYSLSDICIKIVDCCKPI